MKKVISLLMCIAVLLCSTMAFAEGAEKTYLGTIRMHNAFELHCTLPEDYSVSDLSSEVENGGLLAVIRSEDPAKPSMMLSIAFDELLAEVDRLNDLDEAALAKIEQTFRAEDDVEISYMETSHGTKLMVVREVRDAVDFVDFYTIYKGYQVEFVLVNGMEVITPLTDEEIQQAVDFLSDLDFVPTEAEAD